MSCTIVRTLLCIAAIMLLASPAGAVPITWNLSNVVFEDGSMAIGSFVFDADIGVYSKVSVTTDTASYETGDLVLGFESGFTGLLLIDGFGGNLDGKPIFGLSWFPGSLTNAGGTLPLFLPLDRFTGNFEGTCRSADCSQVEILPAGRDIVRGSVTAVPEPTSLTLLGLGFAGITTVRRWRSPRSSARDERV